MEDDTLSLKELLSIDLTKVPEQESLQILDNNFPCCYIIRIGDSLEITLEEHIYTKYWFHKYHASVFAEAMIKAVKRLATEGFPYFSEELDNDDDVHLFVRWALAESIHIPNQTLIDNIELSFNKVYERANNVILSADLAVIFFKYQTSSSSINRSSNGLLILLLKVSAMWTYLSVVLMLLCPISSFTILMSVPCSSKWVANEWRSRCG